MSVVRHFGLVEPASNWRRAECSREGMVVVGGESYLRPALTLITLFVSTLFMLESDLFTPQVC